MKQSYDRTLFISNEELRKAKIIITIFDNTKYEVNEGFSTVEYTGLISWDIIEGGEEAAAIECDINELGEDERHEYLVLHFENGSTATFRNSHTIMHIR